MNSCEIPTAVAGQDSEPQDAVVQTFTADAQLYHALSSSTDDYIYLCNMSTGVFYFPQRMVDEFGLPGQVLENAIELWGAKIHADDRENYFADLQKMRNGETDIHNQEYRVHNRKGTLVWLRCRGYLCHDKEGKSSLFAGIITNLGKRSTIDYLTGLRNKYEFENALCTQLGAGEGETGVLLLGLDNFKHVNNLHGWEYGDDVLRIAAQKLQLVLPQKASIYRLDGDTFGVTLAGAGEAELVHLYELAAVAFKGAQEYGGKRYYCTLSGGCAVTTGQLLSFYTLFKRAEYALENSKAYGKNCISCYNAEQMGAKDRNLLLIEQLRESVADNFRNFNLFFQPQVSTMDRIIVGAEALLRWHCDEFGVVSPAEFVPLLEQTGLIQMVGRWVIREAMKTCLRWRKMYKPSFCVSVNLSYLQLMESDFIPFIREQLDELGLNASGLHVEITESCIASGSRSLTSAFASIRELGVSIEMDDFGTGYSSLEILKNEPADVVKIDRAFVKDITRSDFDATFIRFVVALCHSVDILVCLEGVETWEEYDLVRPMEVDLIQGFLFGKPVSVSDFEKLHFLQA